MSKRGITIVVVLILGALALATWGGTKLGNNTPDNPPENTQAKLASSAEQTPLEQASEVLNSRLLSTTAELTQVQSDYAAVQSDYAALKQENEVLNNRLSSTTASLSQMQSQYDALKQDNANLLADVTVKNAALADSQAAYTTLQRSNTRLQAQLTSTTEDLSDVQSKYQDLLLDYDDIQAQLTSAQADVSNLTARYTALEGTKQWVVDSRLNVKISTEPWQGNITLVKGEVTNSSGKTIGRVCVIVSRYNTDGTLRSLDPPPSFIYNLAPGAVGNFNYYSSTGETVKITILGDY